MLDKELQQASLWQLGELIQNMICDQMKPSALCRNAEFYLCDHAAKIGQKFISECGKITSTSYGMKNPTIEKSTLQFLKELAKNNNREWFTTNKAKYEKAHKNMIEFVDALIPEMNKHDVLVAQTGRQSLYRIYNDVRFSKDKSPYKPRFAFGFQRETKLRRGGYYVHIAPGASFLGCGFFSPNPDDLKRIRQDIDGNYDQWKKLLKSKVIKDNFGELQGEKVLTAPKGFSKDNPAIDLLRHKQFILRHHFTDDEVLSENFGKEINRIFKSVRPYLDHMSEVLTTDLNGESLF